MIQFFRLTSGDLLKARKSPKLIRILRTYTTDDGELYDKHVWVLPSDAGKDPKQLPLFEQKLEGPVQFDLLDEPEVQERLKEIAKKKQPILVIPIAAPPAEKIESSVPEKYSKEPIKSVEYKIVSKGRKWFKGKAPGKNYEVDIAINDTSKDFKVGDSITFDAVVGVESSKFGTKISVFPVSQEYKESKKLVAAKRVATANASAYEDRAEKWLRFIDEALIKGYWYTRGGNEVNAIIDKMIENGVDSSNLQARYRRLLDRWENRKSNKKNHDEKTESEKVTTASKPEKKGDVFVSGGSGYGYSKFMVGDVIKNPHKDSDIPYLKIVSASSRYFPEDGLSFGVGDERGYVHTAWGVKATAEEAAPVIQHEAFIARENVRKAALKKYIGTIKSTGTMPRNESPVGEKIIIEPSSYYGSRKWFVFGEGHVWYVEEHGLGGDDWSNNNLPGAEGWKVAASPEFMAELRESAGQAEYFA